MTGSSLKTPTILATSAGFRRGERTELAPGRLFRRAIKLAGSPRRPKVCFLGTASGDQRHGAARITEAFMGTDVEVSHLYLFPMPNVPDMRAHLLAQDVVWVGGGSVAALLAMWRLHRLDEIFADVWQAGVVLGGVSAGSVCWHQGGPTDSFGPKLESVTNGLAFLPYGNGVHYDSEPQRRPLLHELVADGVFETAYATDDGTGLVYHDMELAESVTEIPEKSTYRIARDSNGVVTETALPTRLV